MPTRQHSAAQCPGRIEPTLKVVDWNEEVIKGGVSSLDEDSVSKGLAEQHTGLPSIIYVQGALECRIC